MKRIRLALTVLLLPALAQILLGNEAPVAVEYVDADQVFIKSPQWNAKEKGSWLFTCRLEVSAERLVKPVAYLHFYSQDEEEEIVWEYKKIVRRNQFKRSVGSRKAFFARAVLEKLPEGLESLKVEFVNESPDAEREKN